MWVAADLYRLSKWILSLTNICFWSGFLSQRSTFSNRILSLTKICSCFGFFHRDLYMFPNRIPFLTKIHFWFGFLSQIDIINFKLYYHYEIWLLTWYDEICWMYIFEFILQNLNIIMIMKFDSLLDMVRSYRYIKPSIYNQILHNTH